MEAGIPFGLLDFDGGIYSLPSSGITAFKGYQDPSAQRMSLDLYSNDFTTLEFWVDKNFNLHVMVEAYSNLNASNITSGTVPPANLPVATTSAFGAMKPDGTTITSVGGVMSAVGGGGGGGGSSGLIGFCQMIQGIMSQPGNQVNVLPLGTASGNNTGNNFSTANDIFSQCVCPQDSWVSNMWLKITSHSTGVAYLGTGTNYCAGIATNGVAVPFSVLSVYFKSDGSTTKTNSGTKSLFIKAGTAVTCIVSNANATALSPDLGITVPFYQLGGGGTTAFQTTGLPFYRVPWITGKHKVSIFMGRFSIRNLPKQTFHSLFHRHTRSQTLF